FHALGHRLFRVRRWWALEERRSRHARVPLRWGILERGSRRGIGPARTPGTIRRTDVYGDDVRDVERLAFDRGRRVSPLRQNGEDGFVHVAQPFDHPAVAR